MTSALSPLLSSSVAPSRLVLYLIKKRLLSSSLLPDIQSDALKENTPLIHYLVKQRHIDSAAILACAAELYHLSIYDLTTYDLDLLPQKYICLPLIKQHYVLPLYQREDHLVIAMADPSDHQAIEDFSFLFNQTCIITIVDASHLQTAIIHLIDRNEKSEREASLRSIPIIETHASPIHQHHIEDAPVTAYIYQLLQDAVDQKVSDIHFEPYADFYRIRLRQDGILIDYASPPPHVAPQLSARIKVMAELNIAERRLPQDGRFEFTTRQGHSVDIRVSVCPVIHGEKLALRLLNTPTQTLSLDNLGLEANQKQQLEHSLERTSGLILITGPTGSGKSITLYSLLNYLNNGYRNISSVEDPVEIQLNGINQVAIQPSIGLDFAQVLRCLLRQDPDIIMIGEIRDAETAQVACKAAQTGHLVLSTLHTQNAASALIRMQQLGVSGAELANCLKLIMAQRLVRCLCTHCHTEKNTSHTPLSHVSEPFYIYKHCPHCHDGYKGRTGIFEVLNINEKWQRIISESHSYHKIHQYTDHENSLESAGLKKISQGIINSAELKRVL